jgi:hypothetical protein
MLVCSVEGAWMLLMERGQKRMKIKNLIAILFVCCSMLSMATAKEPAGFLPQAFNGWNLNPQSVKAGTDAANIDPTASAVLHEYGFSDFESATYNRNGRKMQVKAARFKDASGAFGSFTFYDQPQMQTENIGDRAASNNSRVLFYKGNILVDVTLEQVTAMSARDLRALADALPLPRGNTSALPTLPGNLPRQSLLANTDRYIMGPVALERLGVPIPAALVDFSKSPDVVMARYRGSSGGVILTLIEYPTPQIAAERLRALQGASLPGGSFFFKRTGPILAVVSGDVGEADAQTLLSSINYDADVTWNEPAAGASDFLIAVFVLIGIVLLVALVFGFAFGGFRMVARKLFPNRGFDRPDEAEIIRLNLK